MRRRQLVDGRIEQKKVGADAGHIGPDLLLTLGEDLKEVSEDLGAAVGVGVGVGVGLGSSQSE